MRLGGKKYCWHIKKYYQEKIGWCANNKMSFLSRNRNSSFFLMKRNGQPFFKDPDQSVKSAACYDSLWQVWNALNDRRNLRSPVYFISLPLSLILFFRPHFSPSTDAIISTKFGTGKKTRNDLKFSTESQQLVFLFSIRGRRKRLTHTEMLMTTAVIWKWKTPLESVGHFSLSLFSSGIRENKDRGFVCFLFSPASEFRDHGKHL